MTKNTKETKELTAIQKAVVRAATAEYCVKMFEKTTAKGVMINNDYLINELADLIAVYELKDGNLDKEGLPSQAQAWANKLQEFCNSSDFSTATEWENAIADLVNVSTKD